MADSQPKGADAARPAEYQCHTTHEPQPPQAPSAVLQGLSRKRKQKTHVSREDTMSGVLTETWSPSMQFNYTPMSAAGAPSSTVMTAMVDNPSMDDMTDIADMTIGAPTVSSAVTMDNTWSMMNPHFRSAYITSGVASSAVPADSGGNVDASLLDGAQPTLSHRPTGAKVPDSMLVSPSSSSNTESMLLSNNSPIPHMALHPHVAHPLTGLPPPPQNRGTRGFLPQEDFVREEQEQEAESRTTHLFALPTSSASDALYPLGQPSSYNNRTHQGLHLTDLDTIHQEHQRQLIQSWAGGGMAGASGGSPSHVPSHTAPGTPDFFTPSFLNALQDEEDEPSDMFSNVTTSSNGYGAQTWQDPHNFDDLSRQPAQTSFSPLESMIQASGRAHLFSTSASQSPHASPPATPVYGRLSNLTLQSHTIHEMDEYPSATSDLEFRPIKTSGNTSRMMQNTPNEAKVRPLIQSYLQSPDPATSGEKTVIILTSKVAQKSYGTEKRFLCPPPIAILVGVSWWVPKVASHELGPPQLTVCITGETTTQTGQLEWYTLSGSAAGETGHPKSTSPKHENTASDGSTSNCLVSSHRFRSADDRQSASTVDWLHNHQQEPLGGGKCVSKQLFITDADEKRKRVECLYRIQLANGTTLGTLASKGIKVISKPSKKRQSIKNMELCIHHGTTVSLFNRIRSQTVSTKYLGVSSGSPFSVPGFRASQRDGNSDSTCFVARTTSWDPFVIWLVDTTRSSAQVNESDTPEDFIGYAPLKNPNMTYPPPPAIALKNTLDQPMPIHYNQHIVLQCLTTGLVSPVMVIRKVDKASTAMGGAQATMEEISGGGEYGDEVLGDPVSQLHKVALQIVQDPSQVVAHHQAAVSTMNQSMLSSPQSTPLMPHTNGPATYLACLNDMVGMHKVNSARQPVTPQLTPSHYTTAFDEDGGKVSRKRRVSSEGNSLHIGTPHSKLSSSMSLTDLKRTHHLADPSVHRRVNSHTDPETRRASHPYNEPHQTILRARSHSLSGQLDQMTQSQQRRRRMSLGPGNSTSASMLGAYWSEDVSDASVWTIVGTDCVTYNFWAPDDDIQPSSVPFPSITAYDVSGNMENDQALLTLHGENFSRDMQVWFGAVKSSHAEYRDRETFLCRVPSRRDLLLSGTTERNFDESHTVPIMLVRGDGVIFKTRHVYRF